MANIKIIKGEGELYGFFTTMEEAGEWIRKGTKQEFRNAMVISNPEKVKIKDNILFIHTDYWFHIQSVVTPPYEIIGKYLFFSEDRNLLIDIATKEIKENGFHRAKLPEEGKQTEKEYVLCLYYKDNSRKRELAERYNGVANLHYRYWKTDKATLAGEYSEQHKQSIEKRRQTKLEEN